MSKRVSTLTACALLLALPATLLLLVGGLASLSGVSACSEPTLGVDGAASHQGTRTDLDAEQLRVAQGIIAAVRALPATSDSRRAAIIAIATARQESGIRNLTYGDRDSLGVFQQRPSQGWGTPAEIMDVAHATTSFLQHLVVVPAWESIPLTVAAATVQRPAAEYEGLYAQWEPLATDVTDALWPASDGTSPPPAALASSLTTGPNAACATPFAQVGYGTVAWPVPAELAGTDQHNWGQRGGHWSSWHTGTDFSVACGTPVVAATTGTVAIEPGPDWFGDWLVKVRSAPGAETTWYAHMQSVSVAPGATVTAGQEIGEVGSRGNASGCHLHFEVHLRDGSIYGPDNVDPSQWLADHVGTSLGTSVESGTSSGPGTARIATFNVLGASHTAPGGNSSNSVDGATRMGWVVKALGDLEIDIVGMQEFEPPQERAFESLTAGAWNHFPKSGGQPGSANVVAWRIDRWSAVAQGRFPVPYFGGQPVGMPYVLLEDKEGVRLWVISVHNPADTRGPAQLWRDKATQAELKLIADLSVDGTPVILAGDMNDRERYFCSATASGILHSANGGKPGPPCRPPSDMAIDWIMGTDRVAFTGYTSTRRPPLDRASDHPLIYSYFSLG